jgi:hypothetical protein
MKHVVYIEIKHRLNQPISAAAANGPLKNVHTILQKSRGFCMTNEKKVKYRHHLLFRKVKPCDIRKRDSIVRSDRVNPYHLISIENQRSVAVNKSSR